MAYDEAGNCSVKLNSISQANGTTPGYIKYVVDKNTDRPEVNITRISGDGATLMYGNNSEINGNVKDDDSTSTAVVSGFAAASKALESLPDLRTAASDTTVAVLGLDTSGKEAMTTITVPAGKTYYTVSHSVTVNGTAYSAYDVTVFDKSSGDWTFTPYNINDGAKQIFFYITDNAGTSFKTSAQATSAGVYLNNPKIQFMSGTKTDNNAAVTYLSDSKSPTYNGTLMAYSATDSGWDAATWNQPSTSTIVGGKTGKYAQFKLSAKDASGIAGMTLVLTDAEQNVVASYATANTIGTNTNSYTVAGTFTATESEVDTEWVLPTVTLYSDQIASGTMNATVTVYDRCGLYYNGSNSFTVDNGAPEITVYSPLSTDEVTSGVTISGSASDIGAAGIADGGLYWLIPTAAQRDMTDEQIIALDSWDNTLAANKSVRQWAFDFNGSESGDAETLRKSLVHKCSDTYSTDSANNVYTIPVYFKVVDVVGNVTLIRDWTLKYNRDGDKPKTVLTYPSSSDYNGATYATMGGTIRATGTAEDNVSVSKVYYQIDWDGDGTFDDYSASSGT